MPPIQDPVRWRQAFHDVERSESAVGDVFHRHTLAVAGRPDQTFGCDLDATRSGPVVIGRLDYTVDMRLDCPYVAGYHINVPMRGALDSRCGSTDLRVLPGTAALYDKHVSAVLGTRMRTGFGMFAIKIDEQALEGTLECMLGRRLRDTIHLGPTMNLATGPGRQWWALTMSVLWNENRTGLLTHPLLARPAIDMFLSGLLLVSRHQYSDALHDVKPDTPSTVRRARSYIGDRLDQPLSTLAVARAVGVSARSLQRAFAEHLGVTPARYIRERRLERAHLDLVHGAHDGIRVTDVAIRWGFLNPGRFASEYRARYGHYPSDELPRAARHAPAD